MERVATIERKTKETHIRAELSLDGQGKNSIETGVGFFDHMLTLLAYHGFFDLELSATGDLHVDYHHTVEDVGIVLGQCFSSALGTRKGIRRYGSAWVPMDEALCHVCIDVGGRPYLVFNCSFNTPRIGSFDVELVEEFLRAFSNHLNANIHVNCLYGKNAHHMAEAIFKALGRALDIATQIDERVRGHLSTKGLLSEDSTKSFEC